MFWVRSAPAIRPAISHGARRGEVGVIVAEEVADRAGGRRADVAARHGAEPVLVVEGDGEAVQIDHRNRERSRPPPASR